MKNISEFIDNAINDFIKINKLDPYSFFNANLLIDIKKIWDNQFPEVFQKNIKINKYKDNILYFKVQDPIWKKECLMQKTKIIEVINKELKENYIKDIKVK